MGRKFIAGLTGAGIGAESGIPTFRDSDGLWDQYKIEEVASIIGWEANPAKLLEFYNKRRAELKHINPNAAHYAIAELEKFYNVTVLTQNVDDFHERAGSTNVIHIHGEI